MTWCTPAHPSVHTLHVSGYQISGYFGGKTYDHPRLVKQRQLKSPYQVPKPRKQWETAFQVAAPFLWNKLPSFAREATNLGSFKTLIKTFLFKESFQLS